MVFGWLGSRVVSVLDSGAEGPGFKSQSRLCRVTVLCLCSPSSKIGSSPLKGYEGNCGHSGTYWQPIAGLITHVTCRLTAKNRDQLRKPTLGNRVWATFTFSHGVYLYFSTGNGQPREPALCQLYRRTFVPYSWIRHFTIAHCGNDNRPS